MDWMNAVWFIFGFFVGDWVGVLVMAMMFIAKDADRRIEEEHNAQPEGTD